MYDLQYMYVKIGLKTIYLDVYNETIVMLF